MLKRSGEDANAGRRRQLAKLAGVIANPNSAPALNRIMLKRRTDRAGSSATRPGDGRLARPVRSSAAAPAATSKYKNGLSGLWMNAPGKTASPDVSDSNKIDDQEEPTFESPTDSDDSSTYLSGGAETSGRVSSRTRLDLQTNNSKKEGRRVSTGGPPTTTISETASNDYEVVSDLLDPISLENTSAVAKGSDAMVKNSMSRPTEIIDTSKLVEEGKVATEYEEEPEIIEEQDHALVDEYEKMFAYARRLRKLLNMELKSVEKGSIETNFLLIKAHEHPTQRFIDRWRNVDFGVPYDHQVKRQKKVADYLVTANKKKKKGPQPEPVYPDLLKFTVRFRKDNSEKRWKDYLAYRQKLKKSPAGKKNPGPVPKPNDKYVFAYQDIWSSSMVVFVKPTATVRDIIDPVFSRIGLERRADFVYTVGCFNNDKRAGKAKIMGVPTSAEEVEIFQPACELYKRNCTEIYVNDNRCDMFAIFPEYYNKGKPDPQSGPNNKKGKKGKAPAAAPKNKSNAADTDIEDELNNPAGDVGALADASNTAEVLKYNANNQVVEQAQEAIEEEAVPAALPSSPRSATRLLSEEADAFEASAAATVAAAASPVWRDGRSPLAGGGCGCGEELLLLQENCK